MSQLHLHLALTQLRARSKNRDPMPHVTFIHGIANKPPKEKLLENWEAYLVQGGLNLATEGVSTSMVYWADVL